MYAEGKKYLGYQNFSDCLALSFALICQYYYWNTGNIETGYFIPAEDSYYEVFMLPMFLLMYLNLILQHNITFNGTRFFVVMVNETISEAAPFFMILAMFIVSYTHILMLIQGKDNYKVFRMAYALSLGELDEYASLSTTGFFVFTAYTIIITLFLMNLVIAILSDKYEEVMTHRLYFEGRAMLEKSIAYEKMILSFRLRNEE